MTTKKVFVIDTNIILYSPKCLDTFADNYVVIPAICLEELDNFKKLNDSRGFNAREFIRNLDDLKNGSDLKKGISTKSGGKVFVRYLQNEICMPKEFANNNADNIILQTTLQTQKEFPELKTILVSKDIHLRVKANLLDIESEDYYHDKVEHTESFNNSNILVSDDVIQIIYSKNYISLNDLISKDPKIDETLIRRRYLMLTSRDNPKKSVLVKYNYKKEEFYKITNNHVVMGLTATNYQQKLLLDALLDQEIKVIFAIGTAGTGKTLLATAAGLEQALNGVYRKMIITRSPVPLGKDVGFLPGDIYSKIEPWVKPVYDSLDFILSNISKYSKEGSSQDKKNKGKNNKNEKQEKNKYNNLTIEYLKELNLLEIESFTHLRGRTFTNAFVIIDEAQNLTPHEIKTIITRIGKGSKLVVIGDIFQIDNPNVDDRDNGLTYASEKFKALQNNIAATIYLDIGERSELSNIASQIL